MEDKIKTLIKVYEKMAFDEYKKAKRLEGKMDRAISWSDAVATQAALEMVIRDLEELLEEEKECDKEVGMHPACRM